MSESYQHVVKGGLKLKGGAAVTSGGVGKKKKKKGKDKGKEVRAARVSLPNLAINFSPFFLGTEKRKPQPTILAQPHARPRRAMYAYARPG
jgi:hypothetical protein